MSPENDQEYFADGLTEDIITELSRLQTFFVIARHSAFVYKGKPVAVQDVGRELGVHYVVEGSVRKAGNRLRVTVQLIEAASGNHIWAERYDRKLVDIFELHVPVVGFDGKNLLQQRLKTHRRLALVVSRFKLE